MEIHGCGIEYASIDDRCVGWRSVRGRNPHKGRHPQGKPGAKGEEKESPNVSDVSSKPPPPLPPGTAQPNPPETPPIAKPERDERGKTREKMTMRRGNGKDKWKDGERWITIRQRIEDGRTITNGAVTQNGLTQITIKKVRQGKSIDPIRVEKE